MVKLLKQALLAVEKSNDKIIRVNSRYIQKNHFSVSDFTFTIGTTNTPEEATPFQKY